MLATNVRVINAELLSTVVGDHWPETQTLEFKRDAPGRLDQHKHEISKDVCALANAEGGDLVFGIDAPEGTAKSLAPIMCEPPEKLKERIQQILGAAIEPRITGVQMQDVPIGDDGGYVLVVRVPASFLGPHSIRVNSSRRFVMRTGTTTSDLTWDQLRAAFDRTNSLTGQARAFIRERIEFLQQEKAPIRLLAGPIRVVHLVPLAGLSLRQAVDFQQVSMTLLDNLVEPDWGGGTPAFNLDGLLAFTQALPGIGYAQVFRSGALEAASVCLDTSGDPSRRRERFIFPEELAPFFRERTSRFLDVARCLGFAGPCVVSFSLLNVGGLQLKERRIFSHAGMPVADRPHLIAPEAWVENLDGAETDTVVCPLLDILYQGFGFQRCPDFDRETGKYRSSSQA